MNQTTDTELKELIQALDKKIETRLVEIEKKIDAGFAEIKSDLKVVDTRLTEVEKKIDKQDNRLWAFVAIILTAALGTIWKILL